jgi:hypothetical protein
MAVSEIIGAAVGVILLVFVAYVVVGSTLFAAETMANAQKDITLLQESRMRTAFAISDAFNATTSSYIIYANVTNTGSEIISDFKHMDVIVYDKESMTYDVCTYDATGGTQGTWNIENRYSEFIHPYSLDPGEKYQIRIVSKANQPKWFQITTANGVYATAVL